LLRRNLPAAGLSALNDSQERPSILIATRKLPEHRHRDVPEMTAFPYKIHYGPVPLPGLSSLVDKNLVHRMDRAQTEPRFAMLETIREYAIEGLIDRGEQSATRRGACGVLSRSGGGRESRTEPRRPGSLAETHFGRTCRERLRMNARLDVVMHFANWPAPQPLCLLLVDASCCPLPLSPAPRFSCQAPAAETNTQLRTQIKQKERLILRN
jgi:hypothetical protein